MTPTTMPKDPRAARALLEDTRPRIDVGAEVTVVEPGIAPWTATVVGYKPSLVSGWWIQLRDGRGEWSMPASRVRRGGES